MNRDVSTYSKTRVDLRINETRQTGAVFNRTYRVGLNAVRLETAPTSIISLPRFIGGIEAEGRKRLFIFGIHHK